MENSKLKLIRKLKYISDAERSFVMEIEVLVDFHGVNWIKPRDFSINFFFLFFDCRDFIRIRRFNRFRVRTSDKSIFGVLLNFNLCSAKIGIVL